MAAAIDYEVLFFDGWGGIPAYYLIDEVEGETPEQALMVNLDRITGQVRERLSLSENDMTDEKILQGIYVVRGRGLVSVSDAQRFASR